MILIWVMLWIVGRGQVQEIAHITVWEIYAKEGGGGCRILCIESCKDKKENVQGVPKKWCIAISNSPVLLDVQIF